MMSAQKRHVTRIPWFVQIDLLVLTSKIEKKADEEVQSDSC